jgi:hypothetical protein
MSGWSRAGAGAGVAGAVVYLVGAFIGGAPLKPDDSIDKVVAHLHAHRSGLLAGMALTLVGLALFLWFLGYLRAMLSGVEGEGAPLATVTVGSWISLFVLIGAAGVPLNVVVWRGADQIDPTLVRLAFDAQNLSLYAVTATVALVSVLAPCVVIWRTGIVPRWLVALGAIVIAVSLVEIAGLPSRTGWNAAGYAFGLGPIVWVIWVAALSITMMLRAPAPEPHLGSS